MKSNTSIAITYRGIVYFNSSECFDFRDFQLGPENDYFLWSTKSYLCKTLGTKSVLHTFWRKVNLLGTFSHVPMLWMFERVHKYKLEVLSFEKAMNRIAMETLLSQWAMDEARLQARGVSFLPAGRSCNSSHDYLETKTILTVSWPSTNIHERAANKKREHEKRIFHLQWRAGAARTRQTADLKRPCLQTRTLFVLKH